MLKLLTFVSFICGITFSIQAQNMKYASSIDIKPEGEKIALSGERDIMIIHAADRYTVAFNVKHGKKIRVSRAHVETDKNFTKASYKWMSDSKVAVQLYNENTADEVDMIVWGERNGANGMAMDIEEDKKY